MAAPRSSKRKQKAVLDIKSSTGAKKRKALTDRSNTVEKEPKKSKGNTKQKGAGPQRSSRRKTREVGSVCDVYVQEKKDRSGTLHLATYDTDTGGYIFTPKGKKTPIAFDGRRHKLVEKTPHPKESLKVKKTRKQCIKERLMAGFDAESDDEEDSVVSEKKPRTAPALPTRRNAKRKAANIDSKQSGTESEEESADNKPPIPSFRASSVSKEASSVDDSTVVTGRVRSKSIDSDDTESDEDNISAETRGGKRRAASRAAPRKSPTVKTKRRAATRAPKTYVDSDDESVLEDIEKAGGESSKSVFASSQHVSKKYIDSSFGQGGDWRMSCAIDY